MEQPSPDRVSPGLLSRARALDQSGQVLQAELLYVAVLKEQPGDPEASARIAKFCLNRGDAARAVQVLRDAAAIHPDNAQLGLDLGIALLAADQPAQAASVLESTVVRAPDYCVAWLLLGRLRDQQGDRIGTLIAWYQAVTRAQRLGQWKDEASTPPQLLGLVVEAIARVRKERREFFFEAFADLKQAFGPQALQRVERALTGYLGDWNATPADARQRPKFLYFPDLPDTPYHDPFLQPWAKRLQAAFPALREEATGLLAQDGHFQSFIDVKPGDRLDNYVGGDGPQPSWDAFFFYRHGQRHDANHERCPQTSALLESIPLCRIANDAPEVLFSVMRPGTHILPHHGVTNVRLVMHLPLIVPPGCALNLVDAGEHHWQEGRLVMFDDTFRHEAWNRSGASRVILLMDCWNPHLTDVEQRAVKQLIERIHGLQTATSVPGAARPGA